MAKRRKPVDRKALEAAALRYLSQRGASRAQLARVLRRRVDRDARRREEEPPPEADEWIEEVLGKMEGWGYLDDAKFAVDKAKAMRRRGASRRKIQAKLAEKGIDRELADEALGEEDRDAERAAADKLVKRRRFGRDPERRQKELAALARAGFSYDVAKAALDSPPE
ncbi:MAG: RecX family transcriptional regulator [Deltaproteobacteria bacterium]|nr:RecX family transcriptional regulator [Deltaproteobacteria bacterium]